MTLHRAAQRTEETEERPQKVHIIQGQYHVSDQPSVVLMTLLGSCVAACIHDPLARVGGMNYFLLPGADRDTNTREAERYGVHLMELLVNGTCSAVPARTGFRRSFLAVRGRLKDYRTLAARIRSSPNDFSRPRA